MYGLICLFSFTLFYILWETQAGLLLTNALLILNRRRFLARHGLDDLAGSSSSSAANHQSPFKSQLAGMLHAVQYLKVPVIACSIPASWDLKGD
jgi:immediate early response 3-interacting protein 1